MGLRRGDARPGSGPGQRGAPGMGANFGAQVPGRVGHSEASEAQLREGTLHMLRHAHHATVDGA